MVGQIHKAVQKVFPLHFWFMAAFILLCAALIYTTVFATGALLLSTLHIEQWLVSRPFAPTDCVLQRWESFGQVGTSLVITGILCIACRLLGYRWRIVLALVLLVLIGAGLEIVGKGVFAQRLPDDLQAGLTSLHCPQLDTPQPLITRLALTLGVWGAAPPATHEMAVVHQEGPSVPLRIDGDDPYDRSYPSGHTIRWLFLGSVAAWLLWRHTHMKRSLLRRILRDMLMAIALVIAFGGGAVQFYLGNHLITDVIAGYLLGAALACCAIGILARSAPYRRQPAISARAEEAGGPGEVASHAASSTISRTI
jgi:membrane-associated phospholipid phosphatase